MMSWSEVPLKRCVELVNERPVVQQPRGRYLGLENIESWTGRLVDTDTESVDDGQACSFEAGDVLFSKLRPYLAKAHAAESGGACSGELLVLRPRTLEPRFLLYWLLSPPWISLIDSSAYGSKMPRASWGFIGHQVVRLPPTEEQRVIADFLDRETEKIDALVEKKRRLIELLEEKRTALISHAVTKGLNSDAPLQDSGIEWFGDIPAHWDLLELKRLVPADAPITYGIVQAGPDIENGVPYLRTSDMAGTSFPRNGYLKTSHEIAWSYRRSEVRTGDIVVAIRATVGKALEIPDFLSGANLTQGTARVRPSDRVRRGFLLYALISQRVQQRWVAISKGATFREITLDMLRRLTIPVPPVKEQESIEALLDAGVSVLSDTVAKTKDAVELLLEYRSALITAAVTGQIDVREYAKAVS
jgi:type I restriction enzyme S subunit